MDSWELALAFAQRPSSNLQSSAPNVNSMKRPTLDEENRIGAALTRRKPTSFSLAILLSLASFSLTVSSSSPARGQFSFSAPLRHDFEGVKTNAAICADFDKDGNADVVTSHNDQGGSWYHPGRGDGTFDASVRLTFFPSFEKTYGLAPGDFDEDGKPDLAVAYVDQSGIGMLLGDGRGSFQLRGVERSVRFILSVATGDFNLDSHLDIAGANRQLDIHLGDGQGGFSTLRAAAQPLLSNATSLAAHDVNRDGFLDLISASNVLTGNVSIFLGDGTGNFSHSQQLYLGNGVVRAVLGDLDGDDRLEIIVNETVAGRLHVFRGNDSGIYSDIPEQTLELESVLDLAVADLNEDGLTDLIVADHANWRVKLYPGTPGNLLTTSQDFDIGLRVLGLALGDIDNDCSIDIVGFEHSFSALAVLLNRTNDGKRPPGSRRGGVDGASGNIRDVLFLNGSAGEGEDRVVEYPVLEEFALEMKRPPSVPAGQLAPFALYAWSDLSASTRIQLPLGIGCIEFPIPLVGGSPQPEVIWNNAGRRSRLGIPTHPSQPAPGTFFRRNRLPVAGRFYLQGLIYDPNSKAQLPASLTNGILARPVFQ